MNRFMCDYHNGNCKRILNREGTKSFPCTMCGHGTMRLVKPRAYCEQCKKPIYANVDVRPDGKSKEGYYLICDACAMGMTQGIEGMEGELHTDFESIEDADEKIAYYNTKIEEVEGLNISSAKIKVKSFGDRLKELRKKLDLTQTRLAKHFRMKSKSTILQYEKNKRKVPKNIKEWIATSESTFKHLGKERGKEKIIENLVAIKKDSKKSVTLQKGEYPLGESSQFEGGYVG